MPRVEPVAQRGSRGALDKNDGPVADDCGRSEAPAGVRLHNVDAAFGLTPPIDDRDAQVGEDLIAAAKTILRNVPDCPDREDALRSLRRARWATHSAIASGGRF